MPERATVFETVQIGVESVFGTAVAANKRLASIGINLNPNLNSSRFRPMGRKLDTLVVPGQQWVEGDVEGRATYTELMYPAASLLGAPTTTTPSGATLARQHLFALNAAGPDAFKSFTVERGSSVRGSRSAGVVFTGLSMEFNRQEITVGGSAIGKKLEDPHTMTASPADIPLIPILPEQVSIYVDEDHAGIGTTLMERVFAGSFEIADKYSPVWTINAAEPSYAALVETPPDATLGLTFAADAVGMDFLSVFQEGATRYVRFEAEGPEIESGQNYLFRADFAAKAESVDFDDQDGVWGAAWSLRLVDDADLDGIELTVVNGLTGL